jgi:hypothetical protein
MMNKIILCFIVLLLQTPILLLAQVKGVPVTYKYVDRNNVANDLEIEFFDGDTSSVHILVTRQDTVLANILTDLGLNFPQTETDTKYGKVKTNIVEHLLYQGHTHRLIALLVSEYNAPEYRWPKASLTVKKIKQSKMYTIDAIGASWITLVGT